MPFKSKAQERFMFSQHPDIAKRWAKKYGVGKHLPLHVKKKKTVRRKKMYVKRTG